MPTYAGERTRKAICSAVYTTRMRLQSAETDEARERLSALLAKHEADLAAYEAAKSPPLPDGWKKCRRCLRTKSPAEYRLARGNRVSTCCADCLDYKAGQHRRLRAMAKAAKADAWKDPIAVPVKSKPGPKPKDSGLDAELKARREREREILLLIRRYEAVRDLRGPEWTSAYNALGLALSRHGRIVSDGTREWEWSRGLGEITTRKISWTWRPPEDPHANPKRLAKTR